MSTLRNGYMVTYIKGRIVTIDPALREQGTLLSNRFNDTTFSRQVIPPSIDSNEEAFGYNNDSITLMKIGLLCRLEDVSAKTFDFREGEETHQRRCVGPSEEDSG
ncbi:hypothetical protein HAX54_024543 [Datura stramonium]|uniref:Uncharacterized protein n=1 Tax=Datura stramonium TaxID=4076 RepID=A0ABS8S7M4_DATST|nr:hypothetical protein [Datura stramonium]